MKEYLIFIETLQEFLELPLKESQFLLKNMAMNKKTQLPTHKQGRKLNKKEKQKKDI